MKACSHCREQKDLAEFPAHRQKRDGLSSWCRTCHAEACARWRAKNTQAIDAYNERRRAEYAEERENAARGGGEMRRRLREQVRRNRERDERRVP